MFLYSCHLPKTGGTSILYSIRESNKANKIFPVGNASLKRRNKEFINFCLMENISEFELNEFSHVSGHSNDSKLLTFLKYNPDSFKTYLIIRDPVSLFWSQFYQNKINGKIDVNPESFLLKRGGNNAFQFYKKKFSSLLQNPKNFEINDFLKLFNFIFETKNISNVLGKIDPSLSEISKQKRRVRKNMKGFTPDPLQSDKVFNKDLLDFCAIDNKFYLDCKSAINNDLYTNNSFDISFLKNCIKTLKSNYPKDKVRDYFKENVLKKYIQSKSSSFDAMTVKQWDNIFDEYGTDFNEFMN